MSGDSFMGNVERFLKGEGKEAEEMIEAVAKRLLEIDKCCPAAFQQATNEVYGDLPTPPNYRERLVAKLKELHAKK